MRKRKDLYWGFVFILIGVTILLNMGGYFKEFKITQIGWSIMFLALVLNNAIKRKFTSAGLFLAILLHINADLLGLQGNTFAIYAASILIGAGLSRLFSKSRSYTFSPKVVVNGETKDFKDFKTHTTQEHNNEKINIQNNLGSSVRYIKSKNLKSAYIENNLGSTTVYFDETTFVDGARIQVENNLGNTVLYFSGDINLENTLSASLGSIQGVGSFYTSEDVPTVYLTGEAALGQIEVHIM